MDTWVKDTPKAAFPFSPTDDEAWILQEDGFNMAREHEIESIFALSNGYVGSRGSLAEGSALSDPATFIAGVFNTDPPGSVPQLAAAPDWMRLRLSIDGSEFRLDRCDFMAHRRVLDLRQALLWRDLLYRDAAGGVLKMHGFRLTSLADRHVLLQSGRFSVEGQSARIRLKLITEPAFARPDQARLIPEPSASPILFTNSTRVLQLRTWSTGIKVAIAAAGRLRVDGMDLRSPAVKQGDDCYSESWEIELEPGRSYRLDRIVVIYTSRDDPQPADAATKHLKRLLNIAFDQVVEAHLEAWNRRWRTSDVETRGDRRAQKSLRLAGYHLISAANPDDDRVSIGARALTGRAYKGHVFWDTEIFMLPFYLFTHPPSARALLMYRYHTLPAARDKAKKLGYRGALYAWESATSGEETTPSHGLAADGRVVPILNGVEEQHISADIAYAVWQYWQTTRDERFLLQAGAEILLETARFWASRGRVEADGRYHIRRVIGPDEYHESVDDNAYTNGMAQWNLETALKTADLLANHWPRQWSELARRIHLAEDELALWRELSQGMHTGFDPRTGLIEQFEGFFGLEDIDLAEYAPRTLPMDVILGRERIQKSQVIKQADVLLLIYLLWDRFTPEVRMANFRYYEPRTAHGSSLSPSIHACLAVRLGLLDLALRYFRQGAEIDLVDTMGNAAGGVHAAALGGLWQAVVFGFGGLRILPDGLALAPHLPPEWQGCRFTVGWRGTRLLVRIDPEAVEITTEGESPATVAVGDKPLVSLAPGRPARWQRIQGTWKEVSP
jgi:kojibiose phosphorylase